MNIGRILPLSSVTLLGALTTVPPKKVRFNTFPLHRDPHAVPTGNEGSGTDAAVAASATTAQNDRRKLDAIMRQDSQITWREAADERPIESRHIRKKPFSEDEASHFIRDLSNSLNNGDRASLVAFLSVGMPTISCQDAYKAASLSASLESLRQQAQQLVGAEF